MLPKIEFEVLLDDTLEKLCLLPKEVPVSNKNLLLLANDYEEGNWRYDKFSEFVRV